MYIPAHFRQQDREAAIAFMQAHPFAIIVSTVDGLPVATHLPFHVIMDGADIILTAHFAKANPQWKNLQEALVIFSGPHAYISPTHYEREQNVPTWNYIAVHAYALRKLYMMRQQDYPSSKTSFAKTSRNTWRNGPGFHRNTKPGCYKGIVPFRIRVTKLDAKEKLSQNKTAFERNHIIAGLQEEADGATRELGDYMKQREL